MSQKRIRSVNWDENEKQLLQAIVKDYKAVIEKKCLKTNTNKAKFNAWKEIHTKFNEINFRPRQLMHLKIQWKAMKVNARKNLGTIRKDDVPKSPNPPITEMDFNLCDSDGSQITSTVLSEDNYSSNVDSQLSPLDKILTAPMISPDQKIANKVLFSHNGFSQFTKANIKKTNTDKSYTKECIDHLKLLKEAEHKKRMEMAEEEHKLNVQIKMAQLKHAEEQLRCAKIETEYMLIKTENEKRKTNTEINS